jgi:flagellin
MTLQIGANNGNTFTLTVGGAQMSTLNSNFDSAAATLTTVGYQSSASAVISAVDAAVNAVSTARAGLGALQNRLESVGRSLAVASENTAAANSRVADADIASSMSELVRAQILQQAGISVLAQANQAPSLVLQLLR